MWSWDGIASIVAQSIDRVSPRKSIRSSSDSMQNTPSECCVMLPCMFPRVTFSLNGITSQPMVPKEASEGRSPFSRARTGSGILSSGTAGVLGSGTLGETSRQQHVARLKERPRASVQSAQPWGITSHLNVEVVALSQGTSQISRVPSSKGFTHHRQFPSDCWAD
jgi:hypothetical protein